MAFGHLVVEIIDEQVHKKSQKKIKVPGDLEQNERYRSVRGKKLGNEGLQPGCNFFSDFAKNFCDF